MSGLIFEPSKVNFGDFPEVVHPTSPATGEVFSIDLRGILAGTQASAGLKNNLSKAFDIPSAASVAEQGKAKLLPSNMETTYENMMTQNKAVEHKHRTETIEAGRPSAPAAPAKQPVPPHNYLADQKENKKKQKRHHTAAVAL